jgi:hypothetical protein
MRKPEHFFWMTSFHRVLQSFGVTSDKFNIVKMWKSKKFLKKMIMTTATIPLTTAICI